MIRYGISFKALEAKIKQEDSAWIGDAKALTEQFQRAGNYEDHKAIWRRIVRVYMRIQHNKCAFCERKFDDEKVGGTREFDVEHFRPKSSVKAWPPEKIRKRLPDGFPVSAGSATGYFLLPYHLYNYTVSCKPCNQGFKSNYFPIAGPSKISGSDPRKMKTEKPDLLYPLGKFDEDPEKIIRYEGVTAVPVEPRGQKNRRAVATIVFFGLNIRDEHISERAQKIAALYLALEDANASNSVKRRLARSVVKQYCSPKSSHTNCMRSFKKVYEEDKARAIQFIKGITELLDSGS